MTPAIRLTSVSCWGANASPDLVIFTQRPLRKAEIARRQRPHNATGLPRGSINQRLFFVQPESGSGSLRDDFHFAYGRPL